MAILHSVDLKVEGIKVTLFWKFGPGAEISPYCQLVLALLNELPPK